MCLLQLTLGMDGGGDVDLPGRKRVHEWARMVLSQLKELKPLLIIRRGEQYAEVGRVREVL